MYKVKKALRLAVTIAGMTVLLVFLLTLFGASDGGYCTFLWGCA